MLTRARQSACALGGGEQKQFCSAKPRPVHPDLLLPVLQIIHRAIATFLFKQTGQKRDQAATGAVTLIQRFGSAASDRYTENWAASSSDRRWPIAASQL